MPTPRPAAAVRPAQIVREYAFDGVGNVAGVTFDGRQVWAATDNGLQEIGRASCRERV